MNTCDQWSGLANLLATLIEKYIDVLDVENLPEGAHIQSQKEEDAKKEELCIETADIG